MRVDDFYALGQHVAPWNDSSSSEESTIVRFTWLEGWALETPLKRATRMEWDLVRPERIFAWLADKRDAVDRVSPTCERHADPLHLIQCRCPKTIAMPAISAPQDLGALGIHSGTNAS